MLILRKLFDSRNMSFFVFWICAHCLILKLRRNRCIRHAILDPFGTNLFHSVHVEHMLKFCIKTMWAASSHGSYSSFPCSAIGVSIDFLRLRFYIFTWGNHRNFVCGNSIIIWFKLTDLMWNILTLINFLTNTANESQETARLNETSQWRPSPCYKRIIYNEWSYG